MRWPNSRFEANISNKDQLTKTPTTICGEILDSRGTFDHKSFCHKPINSNGNAILIPAAADADKAARTSTIITMESVINTNFM